MLHLDRDNQEDEGRHLKPLCDSDDELKRKQKRNSKILQEENDDDYLSSISLQDFDIASRSEPVDFEEFFEESSVAIVSALVGFRSVFEVKKSFEVKKKFFTLKIGLSLSNYLKHFAD